MKKALKTVALAVLVVVAGAAHADVNIGFFGPLTGPSAPMGTSALAGLKVAIADTNAHGGLLGQHVNLIERDDQADNKNGPLLAQELISKSAAAIFGGCNTGVVMATVPVIQDKKTVLMVPCATGVPITEPQNTFVFRTSANDKIQTMKSLQALKAKGAKRVAIMADTTAYGKFGQDELIKAAKALGMEVAVVLNFAIGDKDMSAIINKAIEAKADSLDVWGIGPEVAAIAEQRVRFGFNVPMASGWTSSMSNFIKAAKKAGEGVNMPATYLQESATTAAQKDFNAKAAKEFGSDTLGTSISAAQAHDAWKLYVAAVNQSGSVDSVKVQQALENLNAKVEGLITTYDKPFAAGQHDAQTAATTGLGEIRNGKAVMVSK